MSIYFDPNALCFYDTSVFPAASIPNGCTSVTDVDYKNLMDGQNGGGSIRNQNGSPVPGFISQSAATEMLHAVVIASTSVLGHVKIDASSPIGIDANGALLIQNLSILTAMIAAEAVTTAKIADSAVTTNKINDKAVTTAKIDDKAVTTAKIDDKAVTTAKIDDKAVTTAKIDDKAVTGDKIADATIGNSKLGAFAVHENNIDSSAVTTQKIANNAVTKNKLASSVIPSVLSFNIHTGTLHWYSSDNYFIIADFPADAGMIFDFTFRYDTEVANASPTDLWCVDLVVKTGLTYNGAVENARHRIFFNSGDRQSMRFTFNGLGSGNIYLVAERQTIHPSWDPVEFSINEVYLSGLKIFGN